MRTNNILSASAAEGDDIARLDLTSRANESSFPVTASSLLQSYSLEITAKDVPALEVAREMIPAGTPISVTYLDNENFDARVSASAAVRRMGFVPVPHIAARRLRSVADLNEFLNALTGEAGLDRVFVIAGDAKQPAGPYADSLAVIQSGLLSVHGVRQVGISGYPEGHPDISPVALRRAMHDKVDSLIEQGLDCEITTQFAFDAEPVLNWLASLRSEDIGPLVRIGIPGPANVRTLLRFAARCGVGASMKIMTKYGVSMTQLLNTAGPERLLEALARGFSREKHGRVRLHMYPFGGVARTVEWTAATQSANAKA